MALQTQIELITTPTAKTQVGMAVDQAGDVDVKRLRQLEQENAKLKKLVAERDLEIDVMKEVARKKW